jgi:hypothetical protein
LDSVIDDVGSVRRLRVRNRRALSRLVLEVPAIIVWHGQMHSGFVTDLAYGGAFVECDEKPTVATSLRVSVSVKGELVELRGVVRWIGERGVGVQFGAMGEAEVYAIGVLLHLRRPTR